MGAGSNLLRSRHFSNVTSVKASSNGKIFLEFTRELATETSRPALRRSRAREDLTLGRCRFVPSLVPQPTCCFFQVRWGPCVVRTLLLVGRQTQPFCNLLHISCMGVAHCVLGNHGGASLTWTHSCNVHFVVKHRLFCN